MSAISVPHATIRREFLGWDRPALPEAARLLEDRYRRGSVLDLGRVIVVVPGHRAGRRLQELLAFRAEDERFCLTPPEVVTEGGLPEKLYPPKKPFASEMVQDLAWAQTLRELSAEQRRHVLPHPPADADPVRWLELGRLLRRLHAELAADGLDFAAVQRDGPNLPSFNEGDRWAALVEVQQRYLRLLDQLLLWDIQTARLKAIEFREITTDSDIILLGTVDLNKALRQMLDQVAERVTAYVVAPQNLADRFDTHGCLIPPAWCDAEIPLRDDQLRQVDGPEDQAEAVTTWLAELGGRFRQDEVAIGVPDETLVPQLQRELAQCGVRSRWVEGVRLGETAPYRLLAAAVQFAGRRRYDDLAALMRHPDLEGWLRDPACGIGYPSCPTVGQDTDPVPRAMSLPAQLDRFYNQRLPSRVRSSHVTPDAPDWPNLAAAVQQIEQWLAGASASHPLRTWANVFCKTLGEVYGSRTLNLDEPDDEVLHRTMREILAACDQLGELPESLDTLSWVSADAFQAALGPLAQQTLPPPADRDAVEILGWLELPLDDSRALIVTSFNEGFVPKSTGAHAFLPDRLRRELDLLHNDRRYARDAYAASALCQSRQELRILFARRDTRKDPLQPSRLVFACPEDTLIRRARQFFDVPKMPAVPRRLLLSPGEVLPDKSRFSVPVPVASGEKFRRISVTRFKSYMACPYRYYLRHVQELEAIDDSASELDGGAFGNLLHAVLSALGRDAGAPRQSTKANEVFEFLVDRLHTIAEKRHGQNERRPAIRLQLEQARSRLRAFAAEQAAQAAAGWRIVYAEDADDRQADLRVSFPVNGESIELIGRIDRIDFHEESRCLRILDYKTADTALTPEKAHRKNDIWIDLQLPLYRHLWLAAGLNVPANSTVQLGYFNLPKQLDETKANIAEWQPGDLEAADDEARRVIRNLRQGIFWPPMYAPVPDYSEDLAAICLDNMRGRPAVGEATEGGAA